MHSSLIQEIDGLIQGKSLLKTEFYLRWQAGTLPLEALRTYAGQYLHFEAAFPTFLSAIHSQCEDRETRQDILQNLWDEEYGDHNHRAMWLQFCEGIGLPSEDAQATIAITTTNHLVETMKSLANSSVTEGLAALYAYESQLPAVAEHKTAGPREFYGVTDEATVEFFTLHADLDKKHSSREAESIARLTLDTNEQQRVKEAVSQALDAWWAFLDGIAIPEEPKQAV